MSKREHDSNGDVEAHMQKADISNEFDEKRHWSWEKWKWYTAPTINAIRDRITTSQLYRHQDILGRKTTRPKDVVYYVSPTDGKVTKMLVQATKDAFSTPSGDWRRTKLEGNAPILLRLSFWVLKLLEKEGGAYTPSDWAVIVGRLLIVVPIQLVIVSLPMGISPPPIVRYKPFPARCSEHPKYARNELLDAKPGPLTEVTYGSQTYAFTGEYTRLLRPRYLVFLREDGAFVEPDHSVENKSDVPYLFISYTHQHFNPADRKTCEPLYNIADRITRDAGLVAYWIVHLCI